MADTVQMNTRINRSIKSAGDSILRRYGYSPSSAVQALWTYLVEENALPDFMPVKKLDTAKEARRKEIEADKGVAWRLYSEITDASCLSPEIANLSVQELEELAWEERGAFDE